MSKSTFDPNPHHLALSEQLWEKYKNLDYTGVEFVANKFDFGDGENGIEFIFKDHNHFLAFIKIITSYHNF